MTTIGINEFPSKREIARHEDLADNNFHVVSGRGGHQIGGINISGDARVHIGDNYGWQDSADQGPHFWVNKTPTVHFTGRADHLQSMFRWFQVDDNPKPFEHKMVVLEGMGGSGKTQLALKFAHSVRSK